MRMRRKRNLDTFVTMYPDLLIIPEKPDLNTEKALEHQEYIDFKSLLGDKPLEVEIGCGKGGFICEMARLHPEKAFVAVECSKNVIVEGCRKAREMNLTNLRFMNCAAEILPCFLAPDSVDRIYLNFSCPYPKYTYAIHRLTHARFLATYKMFLKKGCEIHQKTDNQQLFEFSIEQFSACGFRLQNVSLDLHHSKFEGNIVTEYEQKFASQGLPIYRLEAVYEGNAGEKSL